MSFINDLLWLINELGGILPETKGRYRSFAQRNKPTYYKSLKRLEQKGYIKKTTRNNNFNFVITTAGRKALHKKIIHKPRNDGLATLIVYDIPQTMKRGRESFRRYLLKNGFLMIQKSIFVSPNKLDEDIIILAKELGLIKYIKVISGRFDYQKLD